MSYVSIRLSTLRGEQKIGFDTYIKINDKMILYIRRGDSFQGDRLKRLKEKKVRKLFISDEDEQFYLEYIQKNLETAYNSSSNVDIQNRAEIIQGAQQSSTEEVFENPESVQSYNNAKDAAGKYVDFIMNNTQALGAIMNIENSDRNIAHHGVTVATLSIGLAQRLGVTDPQKTQLLTLGALLHDYGHHNSPLNLCQSLDQMIPDDKALWTQHPKDGAQKLQNTSHLDQSVLNIIREHEETVNGSGPLGLLAKDQDPLALIVSSANAIDRLISFEGHSKASAAKKMMVEKVGQHPLEHIQILSELLKNL